MADTSKVILQVVLRLRDDAVRVPPVSRSSRVAATDIAGSYFDVELGDGEPSSALVVLAAVVRRERHLDVDVEPVEGVSDGGLVTLFVTEQSHGNALPTHQNRKA